MSDEGTVKAPAQVFCPQCAGPMSVTRKGACLTDSTVLGLRCLACGDWFTLIASGLNLEDLGDVVVPPLDEEIGVPIVNMPGVTAPTVAFSFMCLCCRTRLDFADTACPKCGRHVDWPGWVDALTPRLLASAQHN